MTLHEQILKRINKLGCGVPKVTSVAKIHPMTLYKYLWGQSDMGSKNIDKVLMALTFLEQRKEKM